MGIVEGLTVLAVLIGFGYIILARISQTKPGAIHWLKSIFTGGLYQKVNPIDKAKEFQQQVYDEKRTMM